MEETSKVLSLDAIPVIKSNVDAAVAAETTARENAVSALQNTVNANTTDIATETTAREGAVSALETKVAANTTAITSETTNRENAVSQLQGQIDALENASDVVDVVSTYTQLEAYDTANLNNKDIIKVMQDETHNGAVSYYRWDKTNSTWEYIGSEGPYYTKSEADSAFVPQTRTVNGQPLNANVNIAVPTKTSDLTNDSSFVTASTLTTELAKKQNTLISGTDIKTINSASILGSGNLNLLTTDGNAASATKLAISRTIRTNLASTSSVSFDGSANVTPGITGTLPITNGGTGATTLAAAKTALGVPTKVSELENDSGYVTDTELTTKLGGYATIDSLANKQDKISVVNIVPIINLTTNPTPTTTSGVQLGTSTYSYNKGTYFLQFNTSITVNTASSTVLTLYLLYSSTIRGSATFMIPAGFSGQTFSLYQSYIYTDSVNRSSLKLMAKTSVNNDVSIRSASVSGILVA